MIEIEYRRGEIQINESEFFPATGSKMRHLLRTIRLNEAEFGIAQQISDHLCAEIKRTGNELKMAKHKLNLAVDMVTDGPDRKKQKAQVNKRQAERKQLKRRLDALGRNLVVLKTMYGDMLRYDAKVWEVLRNAD